MATPVVELGHELVAQAGAAAAAGAASSSSSVVERVRTEEDKHLNEMNENDSIPYVMNTQQLVHLNGTVV